MTGSDALGDPTNTVPEEVLGADGKTAKGGGPADGKKSKHGGSVDGRKPKGGGPADGKKSKGGGSRVSETRTGGSKTGGGADGENKLDMPSQQAYKLTRLHNQLLAMQDLGSLEAVVSAPIYKLQEELKLMHELLQAIEPINETQRKFKEGWIQRNVEPKERFLEEALKAIAEGQGDRCSRRSRQSKTSKASSARRAAQAAMEEEQRLLLERRQLERMQEARRQQREEEAKLQEQREQDELQRRIDEARDRRAELEDALDEVNNSDADSSIIEFPLQVPRLPRVQQPTEDWLQAARREPQSPCAALGEAFEPERQGASVMNEPARQEVATTNEPLVQHLLLAQAKLPVFRGDPLDYLWFCKAFQVQVEAVTSNPERRLYMLLQQLEGEPHTLVKACQLAPDAELGFQRAKRLLRERYGHPVRQALAFKEKLLNWPSIRTTEELTGFSVQLQLCQEVKANAGRLHDLDAALTLLQLAAKLPPKLQFSWQTKAVDTETSLGRDAKFEEFVAFVARHEKARAHPVYGKLEGTRTDGRTLAKVKTFHTDALDSPSTDDQATSESVALTGMSTRRPKAQEDSEAPAPLDAFKAPCILCEGPHAASKCTSSLNREEKKAKLKGLCYACLKPGHSARTCKYRLKCGRCDLLHPTVLHSDQGETTSEAARKERSLATTNEDTVKEESSLATSSPKAIVAIATVPVRIRARGSDKEVVARAILDSASTATFINDDLARRLDLDVRKGHLSLTTLHGEGAQAASKTVYGLQISDYYCNTTLDVGVAYSVKALPPVNEGLDKEKVKNWPHLSDVDFLWDQVPSPAELLIGQNVKLALKPLEVKDGPTDDSPYAVRTALGWALHGPLRDAPQGSWRQETSHLISVKDICAKLDRLHYANFEGVYDFLNKSPSKEDEDWLQAAATSLRVAEDGRFVVALPVRPSVLPQLQNNYGQALQRLSSLLRKFAANPTFRADYVAFVQKMIQSGYVEEVEEPVAHRRRHGLNYVPHHGVYHPRKPGKIRVVFNCASKFKGLALNDCLRSGPDLTSSIVGVLLRFRQFAVGFMADIEAMFYRVMVPAEQRNLLRFLWWKDPMEDTPTKVCIYRLNVHLFGATSSSCVANFALRHAADEALRLGHITQEAAQSVHRNFYMDDCLKSAPTTNEAISLAHELRRACQQGGFKLGKFLSSSIDVLKTLDKDQLAQNLSDVDLNDDKTDPLGSLQERALGVAWNVAKDCLVFRLGPQFESSPDRATPGTTTRRQVLSLLSQVYDPLGFAAPVVIVARIQFRRLTKTGSIMDWDSPLPGEEQERWLCWLSQLQSLQTVRVPRWVGFTVDCASYELHAFCDASNDAYAAAVYLRTHRPGGVQVAFIFGKARVTPPKVATIPRLELTAAKLAAELLCSIQKELEVQVRRRVLWSESQTVLKYLGNREKRFHTFVANRINAILNMTATEEWRYVPTAQNPADSGSRGMPSWALDQSAWLNGPSFLKDAENKWPHEVWNPKLDDNDPEIRGKPESCAITTLAKPFVNGWAAHYSSGDRFRGAVAAFLRLKEALWHHDRHEELGMFRASELAAAEKEAIKWLQRETWPQEFRNLERHERIANKSALYRLSPSVQDGLLVMNSRTRSQCPIIPKGEFANLIIYESHCRQGHQGHRATLAAVNRQYWIIGAGRAVRKIVKGCCSCQKRNARPMWRAMADLPSHRTTPNHPFETTGIDCFGPFNVVFPGSTTEKSGKAYGVIFTCTTIRAVHLELVEGLDVTSFINALRRFIARRGGVKRIISDNGTNFVSADTALEQEMSRMVAKHQNNPAFASALRERGVDWQFNPPNASHYGGFYERLIRSTRQILLALLDEQHTRRLTAAALETFLCECEAIMNARPLTAASDDKDDFAALTPDSLLLGRAQQLSFPPGDFRFTATALRNRWKFVQHLATQFWRRWTAEYLTTLQQKSKWYEAKGRALRVDDVVLIVEPLRARAYWRLGRVVALHRGRDGESRVADVYTAKGILTRPIIKLCLLEAASNS